MLVVRDRGAKLCDGVTRRELLRIGGLGLFGGGLLHGNLFGTGTIGPGVARANSPASVSFGRAKSCIVLFLMGGPPQHSTWDPKPNAPAEVRGEIPPIATNVPGIQVGELMPRTAQLMNHIAVLRAVATDDNAHSSSGYAMLTGQPHSPLNVENANPGAPNNWPSFGAVVQHVREGQGCMPSAVRMPMHIFNTDNSVWPGQDCGFLGATADPWLLRCEPAAEKLSIAQLDSPVDIPAVRLDERRALLDQLDGLRREIEQGAAGHEGKVAAFSDLRRKAFDLLSSPKARNAFDLHQESAESRDRYGRGQFGQSVLMARRLVEAGVGLVQVNWFRGADEPSDNPCWDSHTDETNRLKNVLIPPFDQAYSALLSDLQERGKLDETLVVCMSEFGRSPKFNNRGGRDHWGSVFSIALAGGGVRGGCVHGESDKEAAYPVAGRVRPCDLTATMFHCLGISPETQITDHLGRPLPITRGEPIAEILA